MRDEKGEPVLDDKGKPKTIAASVWLGKNKPVEQITWAPGLPAVIKDRLIAEGGWIERKGVACFNRYQPPAIEAGDADKAGPWLDHVRYVYPDDAAHLIKWLAHRVQRDDRDEEQREPPAPGSQPVLPVPAAAAAMEGALRDRPVEHAQAKDDQQRGSPSGYHPAHAPAGTCRGRVRLRLFGAGTSIMSALAPWLPRRCRSDTSFRRLRDDSPAQGRYAEARYGLSPWLT